MKPESIKTMRSHALRGLRVSVAAVLPLAFGACTWFTDFKSMPSIEPWEPTSQNPNDTTTPPRGNPQFSVPIQGSYSPRKESYESFMQMLFPDAAADSPPTGRTVAADSRR